MALSPWYQTVTLRKEVREGRSFSPDEFAIALEQVVAGTAPLDYRDPVQFFDRTCFTRALTEHTGMVLRRLLGQTETTAPVLTLMTQFGGGKTHTLTALYHLAKAGPEAGGLPGVRKMLTEAGIGEAPAARVGVFVGNAWDPSDGRETPWVDLARQLAGDEGVVALGDAALTTPPGTESLARVFAAANAPVLLLLDEVLNFVNRHRQMAEGFYAFLQNLTVALTGTTHAVAVISLPRSPIEMTDWDHEWQERITKVVGRVAQDLIATDESEISEVVRTRLFENLGSERVRRNVARTYADWCFERNNRIPPEWTTVDTTVTSMKGREFLQKRFETCYPFHPATLSVFQRKWRALSQFQQTRGALAMLAQWISWASSEHFHTSRTEPLITLGSAPLHVPEFRSAVLGQLGEQRLDAAIDADIAGITAHSRALDADTKGVIRDIHRRVGTAILFESSGGQIDKVAHLPELRFALGEPDVDTATVDNAALALEKTGFFIRKIGTDGYQIHYQATLKKVVSDRRASLDPETEVLPTVRKLVETEFERGSSVPVVYFPENGDAVQDSPRLTIIVLDPAEEWSGSGRLAENLRKWTKERNGSARMFPGALVWCVKKPGRDLRDSVEQSLAWRRVAQELSQGILGAEFGQQQRSEVQVMQREAEGTAKEDVWAGYRFVAVADVTSASGLKIIDLGAGHSSGSDTLSGRVLAALKSEALLNESVGAGYIERNWPPALKDGGAWPLQTLRQSFLNGVLTRLVDPDTVLRSRIQQFVGNGDFGLASGFLGTGQYQRVWYREPVDPEDVVFDSDVYLLTSVKAQALDAPEGSVEIVHDEQRPEGSDARYKPGDVIETKGEGEESPTPTRITTLKLKGTVPPETWNKIGTTILPKLRNKPGLRVEVQLSFSEESIRVEGMQQELHQALADLKLTEQMQVEAAEY